MTRLFLFLAVAAVVLSGCVMNKLDTSHRIIELDGSAGRSAAIDVAAGETWASRMKAGPFIFNILPQMAVWLETGDGEFVETLYVTGADFKKLRHAAKEKDGAVFYSEALPYWASRVKASGGMLPSSQNPYPDAVTSATPMADFTLNTSVNTEAAPLIIFAELNKSEDVNMEYTRENNGWAGQPSLIYSAVISTKGEPVRMSLAGHGGRLGEAPAVYPELSGFGTALKQIESISITLK